MSMMCRPMWSFLLTYGSHDMRYTGFLQVDGGNGTPGKWGVIVSVPFKTVEQQRGMTVMVEEDSSTI